MPAGRAPCAARIPRVHHNERAPIPRRLVGELAHQLPPADIVDGLRQCRMLYQRLHPQALAADRLVLTNQADGELVQEVAVTMRNARMDAGHLPARLGAILGAKLLRISLVSEALTLPSTTKP
jgi:hypothetical protein